MNKCSLNSASLFTMNSEWALEVFWSTGIHALPEIFESPRKLWVKPATVHEDKNLKLNFNYTVLHLNIKWNQIFVTVSMCNIAIWLSTRGRF